MRMSFDDQYLFTVSEDACLFIFKAVDKEGRGMKRDKEVGYAEEILITKSDLEEKVRMKRLRNKKTLSDGARTLSFCTLCGRILVRRENLHYLACVGTNRNMVSLRSRGQMIHQL